MEVGIETGGGAEGERAHRYEVAAEHTGLDHVVSAADVWHALPMDKRLLMGWWRVPHEEIPTDREARIEWLYEWWERIDDWVAENRPVDLRH